MRRIAKNEIKDIALARIKILMHEAQKIANTEPELAKRYVIIARKIQTKCNLEMPAEFKRRFCKNCSCYFLHGKNVRVRSKKDHITYSCLECKHFMRIKHKGNH